MVKTDLIEFHRRIDETAGNTKIEEMEIQRLVRSNIISQRFGKYLTHLSNLINSMQMAEICLKYRQDKGRIIALENAENRLESALAVYLSSDERYGWTWDKMDAYMNGKLSEGHKELIDWAMGMKQCRTGERVYVKGDMINLEVEILSKGKIGDN